MKEQSDYVQRIKALLDKGYSKSELARDLEISRSTLIHILQDPNYAPSKTILGRIILHLDWIEQSHGHELIEGLTLVYFQHQDVIKNFGHIVDKTERTTGFEVGYHGITFGGPVGFMFEHSPGADPMTEVLGKNPFPMPSFGRTETLLIGDQLRYKAKHEDAVDFFTKHNDARIYLKLFSNFNFTAFEDLANIQKTILDESHKESIFLIDSGLVAGRYDYYLFVATKNERAYTDLLTEKNAIYSITGQSLTDSITLTVVSPTMEYRSKHLSSTIPSRAS